MNDDFDIDDDDDLLSPVNKGYVPQKTFQEKLDVLHDFVDLLITVEDGSSTSRCDICGYKLPEDDGHGQRCNGGRCANQKLVQVFSSIIEKHAVEFAKYDTHDTLFEGLKRLYMKYVPAWSIDDISERLNRLSLKIPTGLQDVDKRAVIIKYVLKKEAEEREREEHNGGDATTIIIEDK